MNYCPSCGVQYIHHHGLIVTCSQLQKATLKIENLKKESARLRKKNKMFLKTMNAQIIEIQQNYKRELEKIRKL